MKPRSSDEIDSKVVKVKAHEVRGNGTILLFRKNISVQ